MTCPGKSKLGRCNAVSQHPGWYSDHWTKLVEGGALRLKSSQCMMFSQAQQTYLLGVWWTRMLTNSGACGLLTTAKEWQVLVNLERQKMFLMSRSSKNVVLNQLTVPYQDCMERAQE